MTEDGASQRVTAALSELSDADFRFHYRPRSTSADVMNAASGTLVAPCVLDNQTTSLISLQT